MNTEWTVIGAEPAGICVIGKLLDSGIDPKTILWIDPAFAVGDFGQKWSQVLGNTNVELFRYFLNSCESFRFKKCDIDFAINHYPSGKLRKLIHVVEPLQWISNHLMEQVQTLKKTALEIKELNGSWQIKTSSKTIVTNKVVLATGAQPKQIFIEGYAGLAIPIEHAMDPTLLKAACNEADTVAVFGSSHTAIVAMYNLMNTNVKRVINFYRSPLKYAVCMEDYTLYQYTGLKEYAAEWAKNTLEKNLPNNLERVFVDDNHFKDRLSECNKAIYAIGFERRPTPKIIPYNHLPYDHFSGILAKGLFGVGIGFPELKQDQLGISEYAIGLPDFVDYVDKVLKIWNIYH